MPDAAAASPGVRSQLRSAHMAAGDAEVNLDRPLGRAKRGAMNDKRVPPADCRSMAEVRHGVDRLDEQIVALLAERFRYMDAAARIKPARDAVRDEWRKADVLSKVSARAKKESAPVDRIALLYDSLVESSIAHEFEGFDLRSSSDPYP